MSEVLLRQLLKAVIAGTTRLTYADAGLVLEAAEALVVKGVFCRFGQNGEKAGQNICIPARWSDDQRAGHAATCAHCPTFRASQSPHEGP